MLEHRQLKLRGFLIQTRNDKIGVIFLLPKLPVFGNFSTMFQVSLSFCRGSKVEGSMSRIEGTMSRVIFFSIFLQRKCVVVVVVVL